MIKETEKVVNNIKENYVMCKCENSLKPICLAHSIRLQYLENDSSQFYWRHFANILILGGMLGILYSILKKLDLTDGSEESLVLLFIYCVYLIQYLILPVITLIKRLVFK